MALWIGFGIDGGVVECCGIDLRCTMRLKFLCCMLDMCALHVLGCATWDESEVILTSASLETLKRRVEPRELKGFIPHEQRRGW